MNRIELKVYFYFACDMHLVWKPIEEFLSSKHTDRLRNTRVT